MEEFADLAEELMAQRAADRLGETLDVLIEETVPADETGEVGEAGETGPASGPDGSHPGTGYSRNGYSGTFAGRAAHQAPEVDGVTTVRSAAPLAPGDMVRAVVTGSDGVDLIADAIVPTGAILPGRG